MGIQQNCVQFTKAHLNNQILVIDMLKREDTIYKGEIGQKVFNEFGLGQLEPLLVIHRLVLAEFGFQTDNDSTTNYREIFRTYYNSPLDYDKTVIDSVLYMKYNRCIYYDKPIIKNNDIIPNCRLYELDGITERNVYDLVGLDRTLLCAFSQS
jgi:hypothetical protein